MLCFWTVVLEKTLEGPLNCKEIQPVHPKWNQFWIFIGRTDAEAETPILWPPDMKNRFTEKDSDAGRLKVGGEGDDRGWDGWMASPMRWTWVWVSSGGGWWTGKPGVLQSMGSQGVRHDWAIELNWTELRVSQVLRVITVSIGKKTEVDTWDLPPLWLRRKMQIVQLHERVAENKRWTHGEDGLPGFGCWLPLGYPS